MPRDTAAELARVDALSGHVRGILDALDAALVRVPEADREGALTVLAGTLAGQAVELASDKARAVMTVLRGMKRAGVDFSLLSGDAGEGCGDPHCPACGDGEAHETRPVLQ